MTDKLKGNRLGSSESRDDGHGRKGFVVARGVSVVGTAEAPPRPRKPKEASSKRFGVSTSGFPFGVSFS